MKTTLKLISLTLAAILMLTMFIGCAKKDDSAGKLIFGTSADYAPFEFHTIIDGKDTIVGFDVELAKAIAADMGKELVIVDKDFGMLLGELELGNLDMVIASLSATPERLESADFSDTYYTADTQLVLVRKSDADLFKTIADFDGKTIAAQTGSIQQNIADENFTSSSVLSLSLVTDAVNNLVFNKCDAVVLDSSVALGYQSANADLVALDIGLPTVEGCGIAVQKGDPKGLLESINKTIAKVTEDGTFDTWVEQATILAQDN